MCVHDQASQRAYPVHTLFRHKDHELRALEQDEYAFRMERSDALGSLKDCHDLRILTAPSKAVSISCKFERVDEKAMIRKTSF